MRTLSSSRVRAVVRIASRLLAAGLGAAMLSGCVQLLVALTTIHYKPPESGDTAELTAASTTPKSNVWVDICYAGDWQQMGKLTDESPKLTQKIRAGMPAKVLLGWAATGGSCMVSATFIPQHGYSYQLRWGEGNGKCSIAVYRAKEGSLIAPIVEPTAMKADNNCS